MFDNLTDRLSRTLRNISGRGRLTEDNVKDTLREVRMALLEADVALPVVREFINRVKEKAVGHEVNKSLTPGQEFVKIVRNELVAAMGEENQTLNLAAQPPAVVLMAGLQGAGKTTSVGKLGKFLREKHKKKVLVVSADVYRPAAIKQLETLAEQVGVDFFPSDVGQKPVDIVAVSLQTCAHGRGRFLPSIPLVSFPFPHDTLAVIFFSYTSVQTLYGTCNSTSYVLNYYCHSFDIPPIGFCLQLPDRIFIIPVGGIFSAHR